MVCLKQIMYVSMGPLKAEVFMVILPYLGEFRDTMNNANGENSTYTTLLHKVGMLIGLSVSETYK